MSVGHRLGNSGDEEGWEVSRIVGVVEDGPTPVGNS